MNEEFEMYIVGKTDTHTLIVNYDNEIFEVEDGQIVLDKHWYKK